MAKRILIVTYYWPPAGGVAVQRWLKFCKYLLDFGYEPVLFVPKNADYPLIESKKEYAFLDKIDIQQVPIREARTLYKKYFGAKRNSEKGKKDNLDRLFFIPKEQRNFKQKLTLWIRANIFIPDARMWWIKPCARAIAKYLDSKPCDYIISTGPPHSMHLIAKQIKESYPEIKWIADFRDPWTNIEYFEHMPLTKPSLAKHKRFEEAVLKQADEVITVSPAWADDFSKIRGSKVEVITNGFDPDDFKDIHPFESDKIIISHVGTLQTDRDPIELWEALAGLDESFLNRVEIRLSGQVDQGIKESLGKFNLLSQTKFLGFLNHSDALIEMKSASLLLLLLNDSKKNVKGRIPAKLFEYIGAGRPILLIGKAGDSSHIISNIKNGKFIQQGELTSQRLSEIIRDFSGQKTESELNKFTRKALTGELIKLLD